MVKSAEEVDFRLDSPVVVGVDSPAGAAVAEGDPADEIFR